MRMMGSIQPDVLAADESDSGWTRNPTPGETAAQRFARYTEGFSVEDEDAPPLLPVRPRVAQCPAACPGRLGALIGCSSHWLRASLRAGRLHEAAPCGAAVACVVKQLCWELPQSGRQRQRRLCSTVHTAHSRRRW